MKAPNTPASLKPTRKAALVIPPILLEGDAPASPPVSGPGEKFALGPGASAEGFAAETASLPEAYGTQRLVLAARDPHWLYAHWDLTRAQQLRYNARSADRHLILRIFRAGACQPVAEIHLHPESRHWFVQVECAGASYTTELGFCDFKGQWVGIATSKVATTPPEAAAVGGPVQFATLSPDQPLPRLLALVEPAAREPAPPPFSLEALPAQGLADLPPAPPASPADWTQEQERALAELLSKEDVRLERMGSLEIPQLLGGQLEAEMS